MRIAYVLGSVTSTLVALKLTDYIDWSWWSVLAPTLVYFIVVAIIIIELTER
jgi:hypothetical protein